MPENLGQEEFELLARIAHRYYTDGRTQAEIAREFSLSRPKVQRLLERARFSGVVDIHIEAPPWLNLDMEAQLLEAFRLTEVIVAPRRDDPQSQREEVARVGTPIDEFLNPSMTIFDKTVEQIFPHLQPGTLVVLRSTVYPGTSEYMESAFAARRCDVQVAYCPERIAEGHALEELSSLPQIVGSNSEASGDRAEKLFRYLTSGIIRVSTKEAELAKLFTNSWRYIKFAVANQFFAIAHSAGVDYDNVQRAIRTDYPRAADLPTPGLAAGPCLLKDTMQLAAFTSDHFPIGQSAMQVNEGLPAYLIEAMQKRYGSLSGRKIGLLGMAFKAESDDTRSSLSYKLRKLLNWTGAEVLCTDPYVVDPLLLPFERVIAEAEILVLGAPHRVYREANLGDRELIDIWGALGGIRL